MRTPDAVRSKDSSVTVDGTVEREDGASKGRHRLVVDGVEAEMTYSRAGDGLSIIDHTEVPSALRGRKVGERRVRQPIEDARCDSVAITPLCPLGPDNSRRSVPSGEIVKSHEREIIPTVAAVRPSSSHPLP